MARGGRYERPIAEEELTAEVENLPEHKKEAMEELRHPLQICAIRFACNMDDEYRKDCGAESLSTEMKAPKYYGTSHYDEAGDVAFRLFNGEGKKGIAVGTGEGQYPNTVEIIAPPFIGFVCPKDIYVVRDNVSKLYYLYDSDPTKSWESSYSDHEGEVDYEIKRLVDLLVE